MPRIKMLQTIANSPAGKEMNVSAGIAEHLTSRGAAKLVAPPLDMSPAAIRRWARENDVECPKKGFIPESTKEAYKAANGG